MKHLNLFKTTLCMVLLVTMAIVIWPLDTLANEIHESDMDALIKWLPLILQGFALDVGVSVAAMTLGTILGAFLGLCQVSQVALLRISANWITLFFRNAPWLVMLFLCVLMLPYHVQLFDWTIPFPPWAKGIIGLMLPVMGYISELVRGGIQSIPSGQWEAAEALAFSRSKTLHMIILPQAIKRMLPPWMNAYAILMMSTPLISIVGVEDSVFVARAVLSAESNTALLMPVYGLLLILFFAYCYPIARWTRKLEKRYTVA